MVRRLVACCTLLALTSFAQGPRPSSSPRPLLAGVVASQNPESARAQSLALSTFVGTALKTTANARVFPDQEALALAVAKGEVDVAVMGPLAYLRIDRAARAQLVFRTIRNGKATYRSVLFAPAGSTLTLDGLRKAVGLKVAWVEPSSASGYLLPKAHLLRAGINPVQAFTVQDFAGSHDEVCKVIAAGRYDVGATFSDPNTKAPTASGCEGALGKAAAAKLVIVTATDEVPTDVLVAAPGLGKEQVDALLRAGKAAAGTSAGKESLKAALLAEGVADITDADFDPVRKALDAFAR